MGARVARGHGAARAPTNHSLLFCAQFFFVRQSVCNITGVCNAGTVDNVVHAKKDRDAQIIFTTGQKRELLRCSTNSRSSSLTRHAKRRGPRFVKGNRCAIASCVIDVESPSNCCKSCRAIRARRKYTRRLGDSRQSFVIAPSLSTKLLCLVSVRFHCIIQMLYQCIDFLLF